MTEHKFDSNGLYVSPDVIANANIEVSDEAVKWLAGNSIPEDQWPRLKKQLEYRLGSVCSFIESYKSLPNAHQMKKQLVNIETAAKKFKTTLTNNGDGVHHLCWRQMANHANLNEYDKGNEAFKKAKADVGYLSEILPRFVEWAEQALKEIESKQCKIEGKNDLKQSEIGDPTDMCTRSIIHIWKAMGLEVTKWENRAGDQASPFIDFASKVYVLVGIDNEKKVISTILKRMNYQSPSKQ